MIEKYYNERDAAARLSLSPHTLAKWRFLGTGPGHCRFGGAVRYSQAQLDAYAGRCTAGADGAQ